MNVQSLLAGVNCSGSERRLADCDHDGVGVIYSVGCQRAFVTCKKNMSTSEPTGIIMNISIAGIYVYTIICAYIMN